MIATSLYTIGWDKESIPVRFHSIIQFIKCDKPKNWPILCMAWDSVQLLLLSVCASSHANWTSEIQKIYRIQILYLWTEFIGFLFLKYSCASVCSKYVSFGSDVVSIIIENVRWCPGISEVKTVSSKLCSLNVAVCSVNLGESDVLPI